MAASKKSKTVKQSQHPREKYIAQDFDPSQYYHENPAWSFAIDVQALNKTAQDRLASRFIEADSLISLHT